MAEGQGIPLEQVPPEGKARGKFYLFRSCCSGCLYGKTPVVGKPRAVSIQRDVQARRTHFICHKASIEGREVACAGWHARHAPESNLFRIAERLGVVVLVEQPPDPEGPCKAP